MTEEEIKKELIEMAQKIGVIIKPSDIGALMSEPNLYIYEAFCDQTNEPYYWRNISNFRKTGFDTKRALFLHKEYLKILDNGI